jgi:hypothetical protein
MASPTFAFISLGRIHVYKDSKVTEVPCRFGEKIRQRALEMEQRHEWKRSGEGARFMGMWAPRLSGSAADMPISVNSLAARAGEGEMIFTLETPEICALLRSTSEDAEEQRLWHSNRTRIRDLARHPVSQRIVCSVWDENGTANLGVMNPDGSQLREITEGDSLDLSPSWAGEQKVVYQSAGLGRTRDGYPASYAPFEIHCLDLETGELESLAASPRFDFLAPQLDADGTLYCIRRPHRDPWHRPWWRTLLDVVLIPWRFLVAIFQFFNFFSMRYTGKPLSSAGESAKAADLKRMMLWGNVVEAEREMRKRKGEDAPDLVPRNWELLRMPLHAKTEVIARGVLSFDRQPDGTILYSNGSAVFRLKADGSSERILKHAYIERLVAI